MAKNNEQRLTFIGYVGYKKSGKCYYKVGLYQCACGNTKEAYENNVRRGNTTSCGCAKKEFNAKKKGVKLGPRNPLLKLNG